MIDRLIELFTKHKVCKEGREFIDWMVEITRESEMCD